MKETMKKSIEELEWENSLEYKVFRSMDGFFDKICPYVIGAAALYLMIHVVLFFVR